MSRRPSLSARSTRPARPGHCRVRRSSSTRSARPRASGPGSAAHARAGRRRHRAACDLRRLRVPHHKARCPARDLQDPLAVGQQPRAAAGGRWPVRAVLLRQPLRRGDPASAPRSRRAGVSAGHGLDRSGSGTAQALVKRIGVRANTIVGMLIAAVGLFLLSRLLLDAAYAADLLPGPPLMAFGRETRSCRSRRSPRPTWSPRTRASRPACSTCPSRWAARSGLAVLVPPSRWTARRATWRALATSRGRRNGRRGWWRASRSPSRQRRSGHDRGDPLALLRRSRDVADVNREKSDGRSRDATPTGRRCDPG